MGFTTGGTCSVNPFSAPGQSNPLDFSGLPAGGTLLLSNVTIQEIQPMIVPGGWNITGIGRGYGTGTTLEFSPSFSATYQAATSGFTSTENSSTVSINSSVVLSSAYVGEMLLGGSTAGAVVPLANTGQVGGIITSVSGSSGNWTLTISETAAASISNGPWAIIPVVAEWNPQVVTSSTLRDLTFACDVGTGTALTNCASFVDLSGQEGAELVNDAFVDYSQFGLGMFGPVVQNGGPFRMIAFNTEHDNTSNPSTIAAEIGGTGWNSSGGGSSGLCSPLNPCSGESFHGIDGFTIVEEGSTAGVANGIGIDLNAQLVKISKGHCEGKTVCVLIGGSAAAGGVEVDHAAGSFSTQPTPTVVEISSVYKSGALPAPTRNITIKHIEAASGTAIINQIEDTETVDSLVGDYVFGQSSPSSPDQTVLTTASRMACIDGITSNCAAATQMQIISTLGGVYYADGFNNNGTVDFCAQIYNAAQFAYNVDGRQAAVIDARSLNGQIQFSCASNPFPVGIIVGGELKLGFGPWYLSQPWVVPANWKVVGAGDGLAPEGSTTIIPNTGQGSNPQYQAVSTTGTVSFSGGSTTITGAGTNFSSSWVGDYLLACSPGPLPCSSSMTSAGGIIESVSSATSLTINRPVWTGTEGTAYYTVVPPLIQFSNSGGTFNSSLSHIAVNCNSFPGLVGLSDQATFGGGSVEHFTFSGCQGEGIDVGPLSVDAGPFRDIIFLSNSLDLSSTVCMRLSGTQHPRAIEDISCRGGSIIGASAGIDLYGTAGVHLDNVFVKLFSDGIRDESSSGTVLTNIYGGDSTGIVSTVVHYIPGLDIFCSGIAAGNASVVDLFSSPSLVLTASSSSTLSFVAMGNGSSSQPALYSGPSGGINVANLGTPSALLPTSNCGSLTGSLGCTVFTVAGVTHYIPVF